MRRLRPAARAHLDDVNLPILPPEEAAKQIDWARRVIEADRRYIARWIETQIHDAKTSPHCENCHRSEGRGLGDFREHDPSHCPKGKGPLEILNELVGALS